MARIRTIKPEFFTSEQLADCSPTARLLFAGLIVFSDDHGVHPASTKRLKMEIFPGDDLSDGDIRKILQELITAKLVREFEAENQRFWHVITFEKHQRVEKPTYRYPTPPPLKFDNESATAPGLFDDYSTTIRPRNGMESNGMEVNTPLPPSQGEELPPKPKRQSRKSAFDPLTATIPQVLDSPEFRSAWKAWADHRREIGHPLKPTMANGQLAEMAGMGQERAIAAIRHTVAKGWQGLREPDSNQRTESNGHSSNAASPKPRCLTSEELKNIKPSDIQGVRRD